MEPIRTLIRRAWWRVFASRSLAAGTAGLTIALAALLLWRLLSTLMVSPATLAGWWLAYGVAAVLGVLGGLSWAAWRVQRGAAMARLVDDRAGLRESLSTALCVEDQPDAWSRAAVEQAGRTAAGVDLTQALPIEPPRHWAAPVAAVIVAAGAILLPAPDVAGWLSAADGSDTVADADEATEVRAEVDQARADLEALADRVGLDVEFGDDETGDPLAAPEEMTAERIRSAAVKELTNLTDQLNQQMDAPEQQTREALERSLRRLRQPGPGPAEEMARAMARGEFGKAQDALSQLRQQLRSGEMSEEQREQLENQLGNLSQQLEQIAQQQQAAERALEQAGMSAEQARQLAQAASTDPQALQEAIDQMQNLSEAQKQQLMQQAMAAAQAAQQSGQMAQAMAQMAQGMSQSGDPSQMQAGADALSGQLSQMEMLSGDMAAMQAMMNQAQQTAFQLGQGMGQGAGMGEMQGFGQGEGTGQWSAGDTSRQGQGSGGAGQGHGASPEGRETSFRTTAARSAVRTTDGPIIGSRLVYEGQVRGESSAEFSAAAQAASSEAADAVESMRVPRAYEAAVMRYFGALERRADNAEGGNEAAPPPQQQAGDE
ncbi:MAG: hypothetical protein AAGF47_01985 [Planctomycetota bacterium]